MPHTRTDDAGSVLAREVDELRRADAQLNRRIAARREPNDTDRMAMRAIAAAPADRPVTPRDLAEYLGVSTAAVTSVIRRLSERAQIVVTPHPDDARSKVLRPSLRDLHAPDDDLSRKVAALGGEFTPDEAQAITRFLRRLSKEIDELP